MLCPNLCPNNVIITIHVLGDQWQNLENTRGNNTIQSIYGYYTELSQVCMEHLFTGNDITGIGGIQCPPP